ncbi:MAG: DnaJ domain-containing protein [Candidatus Sericytochromatia bacterium]|nr:DnaJ domain-containing protein [Candidatus Sericytochromatia bacterium]
MQESPLAAVRARGHQPRPWYVMETQPDYYEQLQVHPKASLAVIKRAYRTLMLELGHHPDRGGNPDQAKRITEAYEVLSDPVRRAAYDQQCNALRARAVKDDGALVVLCPACGTKNRVHHEGVLQVARCSRCAQSLARLPQAAAPPVDASWPSWLRPAAGPRTQGPRSATVLVVGLCGLLVSLGAAAWALRDGPLWPASPPFAGNGGADGLPLEDLRWWLGKAWGQDPAEVRLHEKLGETFLLERRYREARVHFSMASRLQPDNAHLKAREARAALLDGRLTESEWLYKAALRLDPQLVPALVDLGHLHAARKRDEEALDYFARAHQLQPRAELAAQMGVLLRRQGRPGAAMERFQAALGLDPHHRTSLLQLAELHAARGEWNQALHHSLAASRLQHDDVALHAQLADLYAHVGQVWKARAEWHTCLKLAKDDPMLAARARQALQRLDTPGFNTR